MPVKMINVFQVPPGQEEEFLRRWNETTSVYARTPGFIETHMHRNTGVGNPTFNFINIAFWASPEAFTKAHENYTPGEESLPGIKFHPAVFEEFITVENQLRETVKP